MRRRTFIQSAVATAAVISIPRRHAFGSVFLTRSQGLQDVEAVTGDGERITLSGKSLADLKAQLRGRLLLAGNEGYDQARLILNPSFDKRPALIVQPTGVADI